MRLQVQVALLVALSCGAAQGAFQRVCYLVGFNGNPRLNLIAPGEMQWHLCTHIIFAFASALNGTVHVNQQLANYMEQMHPANQTNVADVKFMLSVGGPGFEFVKKNGGISKFIDSVMIALKKWNLDGIDIDWEFPSDTDDKHNFSKLLEMLRLRLDQESMRKRYLLSAALTPIMYIVEKSYQVSAISKYVHFVNLMSYDLFGIKTYTNHNSPLYSSKLDILYFKYFNVYFSVHYMHSLGLRKEQIMVGIPFYGYLYYLANPAYHDVYALSNGTQFSVGFNDLCPELSSRSATRVFDSFSKVPYMYQGNKWISYDDPESVAIKCQWIADSGMGGAMTFALNYDDYRAKCSSEPFPLQRTIYDVLS